MGMLYYQQAYTQNCENEGGSMTGALSCNTTLSFCEEGFVPQNDKCIRKMNIVDVVIPLGASNPDTQKRYEPNMVRIVIGINNTVRWINQDDVTTTLVADDDSWTADLIKSGNSTSITFNRTGTFGYHGEPHPWQRGTIMVYRGDNPSEKEILADFQSKLITKEQAMKIVRGYIQQYNVTLSESQDPNFHSVSDLTYVTLGGSGSFSRIEVNTTTGIPETGISPWWIDLEKSYIGLPSNRNENGFVAWVIVFRTCDNCAVPFLPIFVVDAITGKVVAEPRYFDPNQQYQ
ncbi:MAG TPA: hypothetical protein VLF17_07790 [Candidatus Nitrosotenuis sp.]|nr:hypothetical protein [Candidatus Nitrosotenuis sp.]